MPAADALGGFGVVHWLIDQAWRASPGHVRTVAVCAVVAVEFGNLAALARRIALSETDQGEDTKGAEQEVSDLPSQVVPFLGFITAPREEQAVCFLLHCACVPAWLLPTAFGAQSAALQFRDAF